MWGNLAIVSMTIGTLGVCYQCVKFVRQTIPENYGSNPGFGCLESMVMPWFATACIGLGLFMQSWVSGAVVFAIGIFCIGFLAMLLGHLFGGAG